MTEPLVPGRFAFHDGVPYSEAFDDVYHSAAGGLEQARHVFVHGNNLPRRWAGRRRFIVLETGFGLGLNFLATWQAWRRDPRRCERLHYVAVEKHPFALEDVRTLHARYPEIQEEAAQLHAAWPTLVPGGQRAELEQGRVVLTLFFGDVRLLRDLRLAADAIYLDGFAPAKNPEMWSPQTLRSVARLAARGATAATWSVAASVRAALEEVGFSVRKQAGFGSKREMLTALYEGKGVEAKLPQQRKATVVGAGLAGAAVSERLCARGWEVTLVERREAPAQEASGNHAGVFHPIVTPDDSVFARMTRAAFLLSLRRFSALQTLRWDPCGVLQLARNEREAASQRASIAALGLPPEYAQLASREEASAHAGAPVSAGGLWFPRSGWVRPQSLVQALLDSCGTRLEKVFRKDFSLEKDPAETLVSCTADDSLHKIPHARLRKVRGQVTYLPEANLEPPRVALLRGGLVLPPVDGVCVVGASFDIDDQDPLPRASSDEGNLERLEKILPGSLGRRDGLQSRVGFRIVAPDRLPVAGKIGDARYCVLALGSRGLIWAPLAAELVASALEDEPLPVEGKLADALDPGRFARRAGRSLQ